MTTFTDDQLVAIQNVVDWVAANEDAAPETTVANELRDGFESVGVSVTNEQIDQLATAIDSADGNVSAADVLQP